ncbi:type II toxin-antitoxin system HicA family toxin [Leptospira sp. WS92.C1]
MTKKEKFLFRILSGRNDQNINFEDLIKLLDQAGFRNRIRGDHFIFWKEGITEILNLQPVGKLAKAYQVKQVRNVLTKYNLVEEIEES